MKTRKNLFSQINNAQKANKKSATVRYDKLSLNLILLLQKTGYIHHWNLKKELDFKKEIIIFFKENNSNIFSDRKSTSFSINIISSKSKPQFIKAKNLWKLTQGLHTYILSTNRGLLTCRQARRLKIGGELLCIIRN